MATANITREEAALRSRVVKAETYRVTVDVTGNGLADPERTFASHTELDFTSAGGSTHLDVIATRSAPPPWTASRCRSTSSTATGCR